VELHFSGDLSSTKANSRMTFLSIGAQPISASQREFQVNPPASPPALPPQQRLDKRGEVFTPAEAQETAPRMVLSSFGAICLGSNWGRGRKPKLCCRPLCKREGQLSVPTAPSIPPVGQRAPGQALNEHFASLPTVFTTSPIPCFLY